MAKNADDNERYPDVPPLTSSTDLRGRQSVRATFKLTERAIDALAVCAVHLGIKQKSLFDHLIDDMQALQAIAHELNQVQFGRLSRVQKTFVLSRKTLACLEEVSNQLNAPRDALVEYSIQRLLPVIEKERKRHRRRKAFLTNLEAFLAQGDQLLRKAQAELGKEDPVVSRFESVMTAGRNAFDAGSVFVEKGDVIEDF
ncbi:MAG: hypothetical protein K9L59_14125 [Desulfobacterales bacterium]|nr:hypothetical protein [Desulfobacterales bacterium]MCF8081275.1 hypothetical protein [Desulfobacterales bacterium]